jgi:glycyl-tRNA synthetase
MTAKDKKDNQDSNLMEKVVSLCKRRGLIYPGSEIYGGLANTWDYGPYGVLLKNNIKNSWWHRFIMSKEDMVGLDSGILLNPTVWEASGHLTSFSDPLMDCKKCKERVRGDKLIEENIGVDAAVGKSLKEIGEIIKKNKIKCPKCGSCDFTEARSFNLMFKTNQGVIEEETIPIYMRPETAQGIFINFKNVIQTCRKRIPFGIGQIGKAFRNEITPGNFTYRTREFEQMEIEYFIKPGDKKETKRVFEEWKKDATDWITTGLGVKKDNLRFREHDQKELSHYSSMTVDIEYKFPFGWGELMGIADRGQFDLTQHEKYSKEDLKYTDPMTNEKYLPAVIEPSFGVERMMLTVLLDAYDEDEVGGENRIVMRFSPKIAPVLVAILPLMKKDELAGTARKIFNDLNKKFSVEYDESGAIGKRYRRQDEIGTPYCITVDYQTLEDGTVTLRDRDSTKQERIKIGGIEEKLDV